MCASLAVLAAASLTVAPQVQPATSVMLVLGWEEKTHAIIFAEVIPFDDEWQCEEAREAMTPDSDEKVRFSSECVSPTDVPT